MVMQVLDAIDSFLYYPVLLIVMAAAGLYFTIRMGFAWVSYRFGCCRRACG